MSITIAAIAYALLAATTILDKFILNKSVPRPAVFVFYSCVFVLPILLLSPFGVHLLRGFGDWLVAVVSGLAFAFGLWAMYIGFKDSEVSHSGPLVGAATAFFVLILSQTFLSEALSTRNLGAIIILIAGSLVISIEKSNNHDGWHGGMAWGVLAGLLFAVSHVAAKYLYEGYGFYSGLVWTRGALGLFALPLLFLPSVRADLFKKKFDLPPHNLPLIKGERNHRVVLIFTNKTLGVIGGLLIQYAIAIGSVTLVNALAGLQFALLIIAVALLSKFAPRWFKEEYGKKEAIMEALAVILIAAGLAIII
ncbi:hypothetical protein EPN28_03800 [Patescibacteria group bacterium]|nr:MAG: hypothetical protein EPN28_03800 [Patescibacteria group bacterium]